MTHKFMIAVISLIAGATAVTLDDAQARSKRHVSQLDSNSYAAFAARNGQDGWSAAPSYRSWNEPRRRNSFEGSNLDSLIASHAAANGVPLELARRVVARESGGNPRAVSRGNYGLMQIRLGTARAMGYTGSAAGLLDPETNLTYAMKYLAGAHRAAGGNSSRAVALYARGYYYEAKRQGWSPYQTASGWNGEDGSAKPSQRRGRRVTWNDPSWSDPSWSRWENDASWSGWPDWNAPRRKKRS